MDSGSEEEILYPIDDEHLGEGNVFRYDDPLLVTGVLRAVVENNLSRVKELVESGWSVNTNDNNGNTPLHVAVIRHNLEIVEYLLSREDIVLNIRNFQGETPLFQAVKEDQLDIIHKLIEAGANVNLSNYEDVSPLHMSVYHPGLSEVLINHGAHIDAIDYSGDTPLHDAIVDECVETVCMFLFYNADANFIGGEGFTPFMRAIITENVQIQDALFEYVDDFNAITKDNMNLLSLAITHHSPYVEGIVKKGADVNYIDWYEDEDISCAFSLCLQYPSARNFKVIWDKLSYNEERNSINLYHMFEHLNHYEILMYIETIIESDNIEVAVESFSKNENFFLFINIFAENHLDAEQLMRLTCRLVLHGYRPTTYDIYAIFFSYGYCDLLYILLYTDNNYNYGWLPQMIMPRIIFDIDYRLCSLLHQDVRIHRRDFDALIKYFVYPPVIRKYVTYFEQDDYLMQKIQRLPKVPTLIQLARDRSREYIAQVYRTTSTCQFYTILNHLDISRVYKRILMFQQKLY